MLILRTFYDAKEGNLILFKDGGCIVINKDSDIKHNIVVKKKNMYYDKYEELLRDG